MRSLTPATSVITSDLRVRTSVEKLRYNCGVPCVDYCNSVLIGLKVLSRRIWHDTARHGASRHRETPWVWRRNPLFHVIILATLCIKGL